MTFISYAQNFEDVILLRALGHVENGFYIDIGAADPAENSVTRVFYDRGWRGINVEPLPLYFERLAATRPRDLNLNIALASNAGTRPFFQIDGTGLSTLDAEVAEQHRTAGWTVRETVIQTTTLAALCREHVSGVVHFLKIDVEGAEREVLAGGDFAGCRPWIVLVEATRPMSDEQNYQRWEDLLQAADYRFAWFDGLNRFYIAAERWEALSPALSLPPNVFDDFARAGDMKVLEQALRVNSQDGHAMSHAAGSDARAAEAEARATEAEMRLSTARARVTELESQMRRSIARAAQVEESLAEAKMQEAQADQRAARASSAHAAAHQHMAALRATISWRITAPLRMLKLALRGRFGLAMQEAGFSLHRIERLKRVGGSDGNVLKRVVRIAFYTAARVMSRFPAADATADRLERLAPVPSRWLRRHFEAYQAAATLIELPPAGSPVTTLRSTPKPSRLRDAAAAAGHRTRIVHQFHSGSSTGDAITNSMFIIQKWLRDHCYQSEIFVEHRDPRLADRLFEIGDLPQHGDYVLIVHHSLGYDACGQIIALPARKILMYHNITPSEFLDNPSPLVRYAALGRRQLALLRPNVDAALADSEFNAIELRTYGYDAPVACPFLFDVDQLTARAARFPPWSKRTPFTLLFVGRVIASKGQADLVDAFAEFRRTWREPSRLVLVGSIGDPDGFYPSEIRRRIEAHQLRDDVVITGSVTDEELHTWLSEADVYVSLSYHEGFGVPLVEAMAHGVPVIAWPAGAVPYTLGGSAVLLPDRSPATVASAILRIAMDPAVKSDIVTRQRLVLDRFRLDRQASHLIQALIAAGAATPPDKTARQELLANLHVTVTGHVNKTYSLSTVNRQMALALEAHRPNMVRLVAVEGAPTTDISQVPSWHARQVGELVGRPAPSTGPEIVISQHYPVYVPEHRGDLTVAMVFWEESLLPAAMIRALNDGFDAVFSPSAQVAKALVNSGLSIPLQVVGYAPDLEPFYRIGDERDSEGRDGRTAGHVPACIVLLPSERRGCAARCLCRDIPQRRSRSSDHQGFSEPA